MHHWRNHRLAVDLADVVQEHVHETQAPRVGDNFVAAKRAVFQEFLLFLIEFIVFWIADESTSIPEPKPSSMTPDALALQAMTRFLTGRDAIVTLS